MDLSYFTPRVLTGVINLRPVKHDLFTHFFRPLDPKPVDVLELQTSLRGASILPSITNYDAGTMRKSEVLSVDYVKAPRFRPKRGFRAADLLKTQKGFSPYDPRLNPVERAIADDMDAHRDDIDRMMEIMCAQAAVDGRIDLYDMIEGQAVKNYTVDFRRPASHTVILTGDALIGGRAAVAGLAGRVAAFAGVQRGATLGTVAFTVAQKVMAAGSAVASGGLRVLGTAVRFALGPLGIILSALALGAGLIIDNWDAVGPYFTAVWEGITGTFGAAWDFIRGIMDKVAAGIGWIGEQIDRIPVLSSATRGLGKAWDWAFGDDEDEKDKPETAAPSAPAPLQPAAAAPAAAVREPLGQAQQAAMPAPATPAEVSSAPPTVGQTARPTPAPSGTAGRANVPQRAAKAASRPRQASPAQAPDLARLAAMSGANISMDMQFQVQGLDAATFKQKISECRADFEAIVRRVVEDMQHQKARTAYAQ